MVALADIQKQRDQILHLAEQHGARHVRLFGSVVRGQASPDSDLDVLVQFDDDRSLLDHVALKQELEDLLGCRVDVVEDEALYRSLKDRILAEAVEL
ncbi:MAG: nucleotidyltransferase family protein [Phycisphaeraceae bacterium]